MAAARRTSGRATKRGAAQAKGEDNEVAAVPARRRAAPPSAPLSPPASPVKRIKMELTEDEKRLVKVPPHWQEVLERMKKQREAIITPVDTMGCEENGLETRRADRGRRRSDGSEESDAEKTRRLQFTTLVSLMLSSQTKDPITAHAVYQLQTRLKNGLTLASLQAAPDELVQECIGKVSFYRRKTEYLRGMTHMLQERYRGDVPHTIDELCAIPGVGPKMAFLQMQSMGHNVGIGVDTHVHRISNRLGWCKTSTPEQTRLALQSWLPKEAHTVINKYMVGFGQVICTPISPRCDVCAIGRLCPSYRKVDAKNAAKRPPICYRDGTVDAPADRAQRANALVKVEWEGGGEGGEDAGGDAGADADADAGADAAPRTHNLPIPQKDAAADVERETPDVDTAAAPPAAAPVLEQTTLSLAGHPLPAESHVARTLAQFHMLRRLDVSRMAPSDDAPAGLTNLQWLARAAARSRKRARKDGSLPLAERLTWLNLSGNALGAPDACEGLAVLHALHVLNLSHCGLPALPSSLSPLRSLKALVLSHNAITALPSVFPYLPELNTLVLSWNTLTALPATLPSSLPALAKLSASHNHLHAPLPDFSVCAELREVRLCGNPTLGTLPPHLASWGRGTSGAAPGLVLLDLGDCGLSAWASLSPLLQHRDGIRGRGLANLSLKGNPVAGADDYRERILAALPQLRVLDHARTSPGDRDTKGAEGRARGTAEEAPRTAEGGGRGAARHRKGAEERGRDAPRDRALAADARRLGPDTRGADADDASAGPASTTSVAGGPKRTREDTESASPEPDEKKPRKRSARGKKKAGAADADERMRARAGPPPDVGPHTSAAPAPESGDGAVDARLLARAGPASGGGADAGSPTQRPQDAASRKKTRRQRKGVQTVEMDMGGAADGDAVAPPVRSETSVPPPAAVMDASPPPASHPQSTAPDAAPVEAAEVVTVAPPRQRDVDATRASLLARKEPDLAGW
ncbi:orotidine-5'-phosphate decarboxylase [Malassezia sp. CBS 17886]|nr:orotidine-5'-phosphate decarboxylase [Malassezia sp. CBS 17886]